jgi:hypothetical protein
MDGSGKTWTVGLAGGNGTRLRECAFGQMGYRLFRHNETMWSVRAHGELAAAE